MLFRSSDLHQTLVKPREVAVATRKTKENRQKVNGKRGIRRIGSCYNRDLRPVWARTTQKLRRITKEKEYIYAQKRVFWTCIENDFGIKETASLKARSCVCSGGACLFVAITVGFGTT